MKQVFLVESGTRLFELLYRAFAYDNKANYSSCNSATKQRFLDHSKKCQDQAFRLVWSEFSEMGITNTRFRVRTAGEIAEACIRKKRFQFIIEPLNSTHDEDAA